MSEDVEGSDGLGAGNETWACESLISKDSATRPETVDELFGLVTEFDWPNSIEEFLHFFLAFF